MAKRHPNYRLVKIHRNYSVHEIGVLFGSHKNTVRAWIETGLPTCDGKRPTLILGSDLVEFLKARRASKKQPCQPGEIYCVRCRAPKSPAGNMADYLPITGVLGNLAAMCPDCECMMYRRASLAKLEFVRGKVDITFRKHCDD
jgi:hypothetical protein